MKRQLLATFCLGLALGACTPPTSEWTEAQAPKNLQVDFVRLLHPVAFTPGSADLAVAGDVTAFLDQAQITAEDHVFFEPASEDSLTAARIGALTLAIGQRGIGATTLPPSPKEVPADHMMIVVERYVVTPPACPNWTKPTYGNHSNNVASNYACADVTNLGLMIADPRDLVVGRTLGPAEGNQAISGISRYRDCKSKSPTPTSAGAIYASVAQGVNGSDCDKLSY